MSVVKAFMAAKFLGKPTPLDIAFEITHRCNLDCTYCDRHTPLQQELETAEILHIISEFHELGTTSISIDGGEPLIRKDFPAIADHIHNLGMEFNLNSNGLLIPQKLNWIKSLNKVKISLDGGKPEHHEATRGKGSFAKAVAGIEAAKSAGISVELTCVLNRFNIYGIPETLDFAARLDCQVIFQPARNSLFNFSKRNGQDWLSDYSDLHEAFRYLLQERKRNRLVKNTKVSLEHFLNFPNDVSIPCSAGRLNCTIDPNGNIYHCGEIKRTAYRVNALEHGTAEGFRILPRFACKQCWCARTVEDNYLWGLKLHKFI